MFDKLIDILKANPRKIVFTEGPDARILEAAARLKKDGFLTPVLVGNVDEVRAAAAKGGFDIDGLEIIDPLTYDKMDEMVSAYCKAPNSVSIEKGVEWREGICRENKVDGVLVHYNRSCKPWSGYMAEMQRRFTLPWATAPSTSPTRTRRTRTAT